MSEYKTVKTRGEAEYEDRRSRFISVVIPIKTEAEALNLIAERKAANFGARHNVYAYVLREGNIARYSDDGEPHSTAGMPTLDVIKKMELVDVCIVTTRYFGGVLLGTGGLVHAYTTAAKEAVEAAGVAVMRQCYQCFARCEYSDHTRLEQLITDNGGKIVNTEFTDKVLIEFVVSKANHERLSHNIIDGLCGRVKIETENTVWADSL